MTQGPLVQDFGTQDLRSFLERGFGWRLKSLVRLPGHTWSLNFRAERDSDGLVFVVKCSPVGRSALADSRWSALTCHAEELAGAKATQRLFKDGPATFGRYSLLYLSWCDGVRRFPDQLSPRDFAAFVDGYLDFSRALQNATRVLPTDDLLQLRSNVLGALQKGRLVSWFGRLLAQEIPADDVTYRRNLVRVTHGDLHHGNLHFVGNRVSGFFDLEELRYGYPAQDIIRYVVCAGEHLRGISFWRRRKTLRRFEQAVLCLPYSEHEWNLAIDAYFLWKASGRIRNGRIGLFSALNLRYRYAFYRRLRRIVAANVRPPASLRERFDVLRGEPIVEYVNAPEDIPCKETSDAERLCRHPLVSVVMTAYNHERYVEEAIESVMRQQADFEYELLVCEDCSPDATRRICLDCQKRHPDRIRVLWSEQNVFGALGGNEARGEAHCRGAYVAYCEGDDYWTDPRKLQKQVAAMRAHPSAGMCFGGTDYLQQDAGRTDRFDPALARQGDFMAGAEFVSRFLFDREGIYGQNIHTSATLVTREALAAARRRYPEIFTWHLRMRDWTRILSVASVSDVCFVREPVSVYRRGNGTGMTQREAVKLVMDDNVCRVYFALRGYGLSLAEALEAFGSRLALQWMRLAVAAPDRQPELARKLGSLPEIGALLDRWYLRPFRRALARGTFGRAGYRLCRALLVAGSRPGRRMALSKMRGMNLLPGPPSGAKVAVLEVSHKPYGKIPMACVVPVHAGRAVSGLRSKDGVLTAEDCRWMEANTVGDDTGDNISEMNRQLNEFTALYWAWKNQAALGDPGYFGLMHYRRHFVVEFNPRGRTYEEVLGLTADRIRDTVDRHGTCCRFFNCFSQETIADRIRSNKWGYHAWPCFERACAIIRARSEADYRWVMEIANDHVTGGLCSMFLMDRDTFNAYCGWLLPVLAELCRSGDFGTGTPVERRAIGWCGEILTSIWLYRHSKAHPVHELPVFSHESVEKHVSGLRYLRKKLLNRLGFRPAPNDDKILAYEICRRLDELGVRNEMWEEQS